MRLKKVLVLMAGLAVAQTALLKAHQVSAADGWPCGWVYDIRNQDGSEEHGWNTPMGTTTIFVHPDYTTHNMTDYFMIWHPGHSYCGN